MKADGTVAAVGENGDTQYNIESWRVIGLVPEELGNGKAYANIAAVSSAVCSARNARLAAGGIRGVAL